MRDPVKIREYNKRAQAKIPPERKRLYRQREYAKHKERILERNKRWRQDNADLWKAGLKKYREQLSPEKKKEYYERYYQAHKEEIQARWTVCNKIRQGKLIKPDQCVVCWNKHKSRDIHAHHIDYKKPLEVLWLCKECHKKLHNQMKGHNNEQ